MLDWGGKGGFCEHTYKTLVAIVMSGENDLGWDSRNLNAIVPGRAFGQARPKGADAVPPEPPRTGRLDGRDVQETCRAILRKLSERMNDPAGFDPSLLLAAPAHCALPSLPVSAAPRPLRERAPTILVAV